MRGFLKGLGGLVILAALLWLGLWLYADMRLKQLVTARIDAVNQSGEAQIAYDKIATSRSPLMASVTLTNPRWTARPDPSTPPITISAASIGAHIDLAHPLTLHVDMPLSIGVTSSAASGAVTFAMAEMTETLSPAVWLGHAATPITGGEARFAGIDLLASHGSLAVAQIGALSLNETLNAKANTSQTALSFDANLHDLRLSPILTKLANLPFGGRVAHLGLSARLSGPLDWQGIAQREATLGDEDQRHQFMLETLHRWALAGGRGEGKISLTLGPSVFNADGTVAFDKNAQPSGESSLTADHLDQFTAALTASYPDAQDWVSKIEAELSPYLSTTQDGGQVLTMNTSYGKQGIVVNGKKTGDLPPLDWDKLINPPPAPPVAPGDGSGAASP
ncbi:DUF2125 domain-containing protein [Acidocella sp.]|uniref:DUF2125 domain-containing protein n=1 Tax=Acidocella sp. TaxID=50710 RepID=UPI003D06E259